MSLFLTLEEHYMKKHIQRQVRQIEKAAEVIAREVATTYSDGTVHIQDECNCGGDASNGDSCEFCVEVQFYRSVIGKAFK